MSLTMNETKNRLVAALDPAEREDAAIAQTKDNRWFIITDYRVIEIYMVGGTTIYAQERSLAVGDGWEEIQL